MASTGSTTRRRAAATLLAVAMVAIVAMPAVAFATPTAPVMRDATLWQGGAGVRVWWSTSTDTEAGTLVYSLYRANVPMTLATYAGKERVTWTGSPSGPGTWVGETTVTVLPAAAEASSKFTYYYIVEVHNLTTGRKALSANIVPNVHGGTRTGFQTYNCQLCHSVHGVPPENYLGAATRFKCYRCHGNTGDATAYGASAVKNVQRDFYDYTGQAGAANASRHYNAQNVADQRECTMCHFKYPHNSPYYVDPLTAAYDATRSYGQLLYVKRANATYFASKDSAPGGNAFCLECHGASTTTLDYNAGAGSYVRQAGDHTYGASAAHAPSGVRTNGLNVNPGIQCEACHNKHASAADKLIAYRGDDTRGADLASGTYAQAELCYACHSAAGAAAELAAGTSVGDTNLAWNKRDVKAQFGKASRHPTSVPTGTPVAQSSSWSQTTQAEFQTDTLTNTTATSGGSIELEPVYVASTLVNEGFEVDPFGTTWTETGGSWARTTTNTRSGAGKAEVTDGAGTDSFRNATAFNTNSMLSPRINFWYMFNTGGADDYLRLEVSTDNTNWTQLFNQTADANTTYLQGTYALPTAPTVYVRFTSSLNAFGEYARLDDIVVSGQTPTGNYLNSGSAVSAAITASGSLEAWGTLIYSETQPAGTSHTVDVLDGSGVVLASNVASGANLASLGVTASSIKLRANLAGNGSSPRVVSDDFNDNSFDTVKWNDSFLNSTDPDTVAAQELNEDFSTTGWPTNLPTGTGGWQRSSVWAGNAPYSVRGGHGDVQSSGFGDDFEDGANLTGWTTSGAGTWASAQSWYTPNWSMQNTRTGAGTSIAVAAFSALPAQSTFTFDWRSVGLDNNDSMSADYTINGTDWFNVWARMGDGTTTEGNASVVLPSGTTQIRFQFLLGGYTAGEMALWDNVIIGSDPTVRFADDIQDNDVGDWTFSQATQFLDDFQDGSVSDWTLSGLVWTDDFEDASVTDWTRDVGFFEGFESASFTSGGWSGPNQVQGTVNWVANGANPYSGRYNAYLTNNGAARSEAYFDKTFDTTGITNPSLNFWYQFNGSGTDYIRVAYSTNGGTNWTDVLNTTADAVAYTRDTSTLPNSASVLIRFWGSTNATGEYARFDDIQVVAHDWTTTTAWNNPNFSIQGKHAGADLSFFEGFESASFTSGGWSGPNQVQGTVNWVANGANPYSGRYNAYLTNNGAARSEAYFDKTFDTTGITNPSLNFWYQFNGSGTDYIRVAYSTNGGTNWTDVLNTTADAVAYTRDTSTLPNSASVLIRFWGSTNATGEYVRYDDIQVVANDSGYTTAESPSFALSAATPLTFDWQSVLLDGDESMSLDYYSGSAWTQVWTRVGDGLTISNTGQSVSLPATATRVRLRTSRVDDGINESARWDNLRLGVPHWNTYGSFGIQAQSTSGDATALSPASFTTLASAGTLTFDWDAVQLEAGENMYVDLYYGGTWHEAWSRTTGAGSGTGVSVPAPTGTSRIRLRATQVNDAANEFARWDNIHVIESQWRTTAAWGNPQPSLQGQSLNGDATALSQSFAALTANGTLTFDWDAELLEAGENMYVDLYYGGSWHEVWSRTTGAGTGIGEMVIAPAGTSQIRLRATAVNVTDEYARWDSIVLRSEPADDVLASRAMDLTGWSGVTLTFSWQKALLDAGEYMHAEYSTNGGGTWTRVWTQEGTGLTVAGASGSLSIPSASANTMVRFIVTGAECGEYGYFDQIVVSGTAPAMWPKEANQQLSLRAEGAGFTGTADQGEFTYIDPAQPSATWISSASFDLRVNLASVRNNAPQAGLMIRTGANEAGAIGTGAAFVGLWPAGGTTATFAYRPTAGVAVATNGTSPVSLPEWLRITRSGNTFAAYVSGDGTTWTQVGTNQDVTMAATVLVGLGTTSATDTSYSEADYDSLSVTETGITSTATPALNDWTVTYTHFPPPLVGVVTCANCHNVHFVEPGGADEAVAANWWNMTRTSDPNNTKANYTGTPTEFCLECHDGATPGTSGNNDSVMVPYAPAFSDKSAYPFFPGWNKSAPNVSWASSGHKMTAIKELAGDMGCDTCHDPHASDNARLTAYTYDESGANPSHTGTVLRNNTSTYAEQNLCYACHGNTKNGTCGSASCHAVSVAFLNTQTPFATTYRHPVEATGRHSDTEVGVDLGPAPTDRHAECADCHDPHATRAGVHTEKTSNPGEALRGAIGVKPVYGTAFSGKSGEDFATMNRAASFTTERMSGDTNDFEAYVCIKCHSSYSGQPFALTAAQGNGRAYTSTDLALEFNPSNQGEHNVMGQSIGMEGSFTVDGQTYAMPLPADAAFLKPGWTANSKVTCTDCHTNTTAGAARGPHGSSTPWMIATGYVTWTATTTLSNLNTAIGGQYIICTKCHQNLSNANMAHSDHSNRATCMNCHIKIPHGWKRPRLLVSSNDPAYLSSNGRIGQGIALRSRSGPNDWQDESVDCAGGCDNRHNYNGTFWP